MQRWLRQAGFCGGLSLDLYKQDYETVAPECVAYLSDLLPPAADA